MQHTRMIRISTQRNTATPHASDPQQLAKELCSLAGLHGNFSSYDLNRFVDSLNSEQARRSLSAHDTADPYVGCREAGRPFRLRDG